MIIPVKWTDEGVEMIDQRLLPTEEKWLMLKTYTEVAAAIKDMVARRAGNRRFRGLRNRARRKEFCRHEYGGF
jgi:methylthioribose-1-phosphate isomerase